MEAGVSVIICCYNSATRIGETLKHLANQNTPVGLRWEIVLVDNGSTDDTRSTALREWHELGRQDVPFKIADQPEPGLSAARKKGIAQATFGVLLFCDDDNWLESGYVATSFRIMQSDPKLGALGGTGIAVGEIALPLWFDLYKTSYACYPQGASDGILKGPTSSLYGAGMIVRLEALTKLDERNFNPLLTDRVGGKLTSGGDTELCFAIRLAGYDLGFSGSLKFFHFMSASRLTDRYLFKLNESLAYCSARLILYKYALTGKKVDRLVWLKDAFYQVILFCKSTVRYFNFSRSGFDRKLDFAFSFYSMKGIFSQFGVYRSRFRKIEKLKSRP